MSTLLSVFIWLTEEQHNDSISSLASVFRAVGTSWPGDRQALGNILSHSATSEAKVEQKGKKLRRLAYIAASGGRIYRVIASPAGLIEAAASVSAEGKTLIVDEVSIALKSGKSIPKEDAGKYMRQILILKRGIMNEAKDNGFKFIRFKGLRVPGLTGNPLRDVDKLRPL